MGYGYIYKWFKLLYSSAIVDDPIPINTLFVDAKHIYYSCVRKGKNQISAIGPFINKIKRAITEFMPSEFIYLSMDGYNPAAKFQHQRQKKYKNEHKLDFTPPTEPFDMLSTEQPGDSVDKALKKFFTLHINRPNVKTQRIFYSSGFAPGEGEHKILNFIRELKRSNEWKSELNHFIYSDDSDWLIFGLQFLEDHIFIIRPTTKEIINLSILRELILKRIHDSIDPTEKVTNDRKIINDIISIFLLIGNDFYPKFNDIPQNEKIIDLLIDAYISINKNKDNKEYLYLIENDVYNVSSLQKLLTLFCHSEISIHSENLNDDISECKKVSQDILHALNFSVIYYLNGPPSWTYYFPYDKCPIPLIRAVFLMSQEEKEFFDVECKSDIKIDLFLKALINHPPDSMVNIPWNIYKLKIEPSPIAEKYWPLNTKSRIPIFDLDEIFALYKKELDCLSPEELELNREDPPFFTYNKSQSYRPNQQQNRSNQQQNRPNQQQNRSNQQQNRSNQQNRPNQQQNRPNQQNMSNQQNRPSQQQNRPNQQQNRSNQQQNRSNQQNRPNQQQNRPNQQQNMSNQQQQNMSNQQQNRPIINFNPVKINKK